jgi:tetratricopeptide (TPR) repeat protein
MKTSRLALAAACTVVVLAFTATGCKKLQARDNLNKGVQAFKNAKYPEAVEFFKQAIELDPTFPTARLYLATAYMSQYIPGAESPENVAYAKSAMEQFNLVLETLPNDATAIESMASLHYSQAQGAPGLDEKLKRLDEAATWYKRLTTVDPNKKEAYYSQGVIVWAKWYPALMAARAKLGMKPDDEGPIKDKKVKAELKDKYAALVEDGIKHLEKALEIDKEYDDAMAYLNLLIRERADLAETAEEYRKDIEIADNWVQKALETKKIKAERQPQTSGIISEAAEK